MHRPSDRDVNWMSPVQGKSPLVQVEEPYGNLGMVTCRLSSCNPECTMYTCHLPTMFESERQTVYRERKRGISVVRHLPQGLEVPGLIPARDEEISVSEHAFWCVICRDDTR